MSNEENRENRNASLFGGQQNIPTVTQEQYVQQNYGITKPRFLAPLPSRGLVYPIGSPLHGKDSIELYAMTAEQEDILMNKVYMKKGTVLTELIKSCLVDRTIDVSTLISGDRNALMVAIRASGYGVDYKTEIVCPRCELKQDFLVMLDQLEEKALEIEPVSPGSNLFEYTLPMTQKVVQFKFLTTVEEEEIVATNELRKKRGLPTDDHVVTNQLFYHIVSIDGKTDKKFITDFIRYMPARDSLELSMYIEEKDPSIDMTANFICVSKSCEHEERVGIPIGLSFFWRRLTKR